MSFFRIDIDRWEEILITITRNKTRSILTAFGVFWGIFMLVALMGGSQGIQEMMKANFAGFATNSGFTGTNQTSKAYKGFRKGRYWQLELNDVARIRQAIPEIDILSPINSKWGVNATYDKYESASCSMKGVYPEYAEIETPTLAFGRFINHIDFKEKRKVCVIGKQIYESLFPDGSNPCGKFINANGIYFQVIGVNTSSGNMSVNGWPPTTITIPFSTMQQSYNFGNDIELLCYTARPGHSIKDIQARIEPVLKKAHLIHPDKHRCRSPFQHGRQPVQRYQHPPLDGRIGHFAGRSHWGEQHHDGYRQGTNHRNRYPSCHRCQASRHHEPNPLREHGLDHLGRDGRHLVCRVYSSIVRIGHRPIRYPRPFSDQFLDGHRSLCHPLDARYAGRPGPRLSGHGHQTD